MALDETNRMYFELTPKGPIERTKEEHAKRIVRQADLFALKNKFIHTISDFADYENYLDSTSIEKILQHLLEIEKLINSTDLSTKQE